MPVLRFERNRPVVRSPTPCQFGSIFDAAAVVVVVVLVLVLAGGGGGGGGGGVVAVVAIDVMML